MAKMKRGDSPTLALMKRYGAPLTREEYLRWSGMGKTYKPTAEEEAEMPEQFQVAPKPTPPVLNPEKPKPAPPKKAVVPDWNALIKILPNPEGYKPQEDTEAGPESTNAGIKNIPVHVKKAPVGVPGGDTTNPKATFAERGLREQ